MTNVFFTTTDDIIIADPEGEYYPLVEALGGQVIHISSTSRDYINPMDINLNYADDDNPLGMKSDFILSCANLSWAHGMAWSRKKNPSLTDACRWSIRNI